MLSRCPDIPINRSPNVPEFLSGSFVSFVVKASRTVGFNRGVLGSAGAQKMLVIVQAAVSLVLLSAAALLGQSLRNLEHQNFGFDSGGRYVVSITPKISGYKQEQLVPLLRDIEDRLRLIPGVHGVGSVLTAPLNGWVWPHDIRVEGKPEPGPQDDVSFRLDPCHAGPFRGPRRQDRDGPSDHR
jgi:hypothetical protein